MKAVVVVESPAKARTIGKYLGRGYHVVASYGHIRDLPAREGSVRPDENFAMDWEVDARAERRFQDIARAIHGASQLYLATDPDREGEAISWHVREELVRRAMLGDIDVKRITFHEITRDAVQGALQYARDLNDDLVEAYLARRALDYLVGFTLSPVLWRKLPGSRSAGRVQSVALRLICEREADVEGFSAREYWTVEADLFTPACMSFTARLTHLDGHKLEKFSLPDESRAQKASNRVKAATLTVRTVQQHESQRTPPPPFTTSTMQQDAARELHLTAKRTMQIAQRLYEGIDVGGERVGLISYMRTDSVQITDTIVDAIRVFIGKELGINYLPERKRTYKTKVKNAQEAHEAIRPTDISRHPRMLATYLDQEQLRLYELIWKRTVASQMKNADLRQVAVDVISTDKTIILRATSSDIAFDGFLRLYHAGAGAGAGKEKEEGTEATGGTVVKKPPDSLQDDANKTLPFMSTHDSIHQTAVRAEQHFTQAPPRYSEASLVKKLEELGIGRPSTYATILAVLQDRHYVRMEDRRFIPENRGRIVTAFLENYFNHYIQYTFTAELEDQLDDISDGRIGWKRVLRQFWEDFIRRVEDIRNLRVSEVLDRLDRELGSHFFPKTSVASNPRQCPICKNGRLSLKLGRFGAFIGCSNYPDCGYTRPLSILVSNGHEKNGHEKISANDVRILGLHPETGAQISLRKGPYGSYVQLDPVHISQTARKTRIISGNQGRGTGEKTAETRKRGEHRGEPKGSSTQKPRRVPVPKSLRATFITLEIALQLLQLPRGIGLHPKNGKPVLLKVGRYGLYVEHEKVRVALPQYDEKTTLSNPERCHFETALALLTAKAKTKK